MPISNHDKWDSHVWANTDAYSKCCVDVAREVMRLLDERPGTIDSHKIICDANDNIEGGGITGFMAGAVASMVSQCHSRGEEFRQQWNIFHGIADEGKKANESGGVINPALLTIEIPDDEDSAERL